MKIKKRNSHELVEATDTKILITDLRAPRLRNDLFSFKHPVNNLELLSQNYVFYGGRQGEVGVLDCRKPNKLAWSPPSLPHNDKISDILIIGNDVITCDKMGNIL